MTRPKQSSFYLAQSVILRLSNAISSLRSTRFGASNRLAVGRERYKLYAVVESLMVLKQNGRASIGVLLERRVIWLGAAVGHRSPLPLVPTHAASLECGKRADAVCGWPDVFRRPHVAGSTHQWWAMLSPSAAALTTPILRHHTR